MTNQRTMSSLKSVFKNRHNTLKVRQITFLEFTSRFYRLGNRATRPNDRYREECLYEPTPTSPGCAIGQHVPKKCGLYGDKQFVNQDLVWSKLPDWMKDLGMNFLDSIQMLHDHVKNWTSTGLSEAGIHEFNVITKRYQIHH